MALPIIALAPHQVVCLNGEQRFYTAINKKSFCVQPLILVLWHGMEITKRLSTTQRDY